ncbi:hypothetical protein SCWH03_02700 [Streptomyces pacificus]|uniref:Uncharacterized protein n=1 Tax=Streptomyces pacificus TaxID=2705029 RepID=A0A6A0AQC1_9ACTN|nr:hypothetical protein SCWH03_02700 [Streptomyces pacificus]
MLAASALSGWLRPTTASADSERPAVSAAVTAPNASTSAASTAPMIRSRPGSVVAAARSRDEVSAQALRLAGGSGGRADRSAEGGDFGAGAGPGRAGTCGTGEGGSVEPGMCVN